MLKHFGLAALSAACLVAIPMTASASSVFGSNIIVNGDAESGPASASGYDILGATGFVTTGDFTTVRYTAGGGFPVAGDPGVSAGGANFFTGGPNAAVSTASQSIDLSSGASFIDVGDSAYSLSAYLGGFASQSDNAVLSISFLGALNNLLGTASLGPVTNIDRGNQTGLLFRTTTGFIPIGARSVNVLLTMDRNAGSYDDGYADNLSLVLRQGVGPSPGGVPEPATWSMLILGFGAAGSMIRRRRAAVTA